MRDSQWLRLGVLFALLSVVAAGPSRGQQSAPPRPAVPIEPIKAILDAFRSHRIVALSEGTTHGDEQSHAFRLALIRDPRFAATVNDIVVESGNALYQDVMDRFVRGDNEVPYDSLRQVWQNTTQPHTVWDAPIYEEFYRAVRAVNASLPKERQLRVLLGEGDVETARRYANDVIADLQEAGATLLANNYKSTKAHALRQIGRLDEAIPIYREAILAYQDFGHRGAIAHQLECFAFIAMAQEQGERAVKLLSAANALRERVNSRRTPQERAEYDKQIADLRGGLGEEDFNRHWDAGNFMTMEQAIELALNS